MAQSLGSLFVELKAETGAFVTGMSKASYAAKQASKDIGDGFSKMGNAVEGALGQFGAFGAQLGAIGGQVGNFFSTFKVSGSSLGIAVAGIAAVGAAGIAAAAGLSALAIQGTELVERLNNISQKTGISIRSLQVFEAAGKTVDVSLEDMVVAMRKFDSGISGVGKGAGAAAMVLKRLGVTSHDNKEALLEAADAFAKMPDGVTKATDAVVLFGKSGLAMIPFLNKGRDGIEEFNKMVEQYGPTIDGQAIASTEKWKDSTEKLSLAWDSFKVSLIGSVIPALASLLQKISDITKATGDMVAGSLKSPGKSYLEFLKTWALLPVIGMSFPDSPAAKSPAAQDPKDSAAQVAKNKAADALAEKNKSLYEMMKAGSSAVYALEQKRAAVSEAIAAQDYEDAATLQSQIPALEAAVKLEKERTAEAARLQVYLDNQKKFYDKYLGQAISTGPLFSLGRPAALKAAAAGPAPDESGVPGGTADLGTLFATPVDKFAESAKATIADFYSEWGADSKKTADDVNDTYDKELAKIQGFWALGLISQKTANDASVELEKARFKALEDVWAKSDSFGDQFKAFFVEIGDKGRDVAKSFFDDMKSSLDELNSQLAKFIVTGKGLNFKKIGQGLEQNLASTGIKKVESMGADFLGFGAKTGKKGDTASNPLFTTPVDASGNVIGGLSKLAGANGVGDLPITPQGAANANAAFSGLNGNPSAPGGGNPMSSITSAFSSMAGGGFMSLLPKLFSLLGSFGGMLAGGGDVTPGKTYVVGEDHPEFFSPKQAGKVVPSLKFTGHAPAPIIHFSVNGVSDFDSFKRSQQQIGAGLAQQLAIANSRNR
jgi:hypothetical protein